VNTKIAFLARALDQARHSRDFAHGFSFMSGLLAFQIHPDTEAYGAVRALISTQYGENEADAVDNAFVKYSHRKENG
jgi:hypothetical protein